MNYLQILKLKIADRYLLYRYVAPFAEKNKYRTPSRKNTICLFTQPRGGSTWLAEILLNLPKTCLIDEPLWRGPYRNIGASPKHVDRKVPSLAELDFYYNQPIPPEADWPEAKEVIGKVLSGCVASLGLYKENSMTKMCRSDLYIVKFNFAHFLMRWLLVNFSVRAIAMIRHPCAVVASQIKTDGFKDLTLRKDWKWPIFKYSEFYSQYNPIFNQADRREDILAILWAMQVRELILAKKKFDLHLLHYEDLVKDYDAELVKMLRYLEITHDHKKISSQRFEPSKSTPKDMKFKLSQQRQLIEWESELDLSTQKRILYFVHEMGIDLYNRDPFPAKKLKDL